jgi:Tol biopolymer transport system component
MILLLCACDNEQGKPMFSIVPSSPYDDPVWHPSGKVIGFNHRPIKEINYVYGNDHPLQASYIYENDSVGFWLINSDGSNQRRILPYYLQNPAWSPNGKWIAFVKGANLYKMPFNGESFDTTNIEQLTFEGRNFFPAWNREGEKIAYNKSICNGPNTCGIWLEDLTTKTNIFISPFGNFPNWHPSQDSIIYCTNSLTTNGEDIGDTLWLYSVSTHVRHHLRTISLPNYDNRFFKYSPDGKSIAFISQYKKGNAFQVCIMNCDGTNFKKITTDGCSNFSWSPDGRIVYVNFDGSRIDESKGVLWVMDANGDNKQQLTSNQFVIKQ